MRKRTTQWTRLVIIGLLALGMFGSGTFHAAAQSGEICRPNRALALADSNGDGVVSLGEIDEVIALADGNAELQSVRDQAAAAGITGIRYTGCTPDGDAGASGGDAGSGSGTGGVSNGTTGSGSGGSGSSDAGSAGGQGETGQAGESSTSGTGQSGASGSTATSGTGSATTSDADSSEVTGLPTTGVGTIPAQGDDIAPVSGSILFLVAAGSLLVASGMFSFRTKKA